MGPTGNPPPKSPPQNTPSFLGFVNVDKFCLDKGYSEGKLNEQEDTTANDIMFTCDLLGQRSETFSGQAICQTLYPDVDVVDRLENYFNTTSLQCYKNLKLLGSIGNNTKDFDDYCRKDAPNAGLYDNKSERTTAYDWLCQPKDKTRLPSGFNVAYACDFKYHTNNAIERLVNYNRPDGWECWVPA